MSRTLSPNGMPYTRCVASRTPFRPPALVPAAFAVSARHDSPAEARRLLDHFEAAGVP